MHAGLTAIKKATNVSEILVIEMRISLIYVIMDGNSYRSAGFALRSYNFFYEE